MKTGTLAAGTTTGNGRANPSRAAAPDYTPTGVVVEAGAPADDGFFFPAEWARHERTLMQYPPAQNWPAGQLPGARREWAAVANAVARFEPVTMAVAAGDFAHARRALSADIDLVEFDLNDGWSRDSGPMILRNADGRRCVAGFRFNGWGGKFTPWADDALAKAHFARHLDLPLRPIDMVLEGGAVAVDGEGTLLTTEQCLLNDNRNPGVAKAEVEARLRSWLGVETIIWLPWGLTPDPITDGHVDGIAAFAAPGMVLLHTSDDQRDPNHAITREALQILRHTPDARGRTLEVIEVPLADSDVAHMNFYICNGAVIVPVAGKPVDDDTPLAILRETFPSHEVVPIGGHHIAGGGGGVHCITQQVPAV